MRHVSERALRALIREAADDSFARDEDGHRFVDRPTAVSPQGVPVRAIEMKIREIAQFRADLAQVQRFTPFSMWYKGEHKRAVTALARALRALVALVKPVVKLDSEYLAPLLATARDFASEVTSGSSSMGRLAYTDAAKRWRASVSSGEMVGDAE